MKTDHSIFTDQSLKHDLEIEKEIVDEEGEIAWLPEPGAQERYHQWKKRIKQDMLKEDPLAKQYFKTDEFNLFVDNVYITNGEKRYHQSKEAIKRFSKHYQEEQDFKKYVQNRLIDCKNND